MGTYNNSSARLPGVRGPEACPPRRGYDARATIARARRRALVADVLDVALLTTVDLLFLVWPSARIPFVSRAESASVIIGANVIVIIYWLASRWIPRWRAHRISLTWCQEEQRRFVRWIANSEYEKEMRRRKL